MDKELRENLIDCISERLSNEVKNIKLMHTSTADAYGYNVSYFREILKEEFDKAMSKKTNDIGISEMILNWINEETHMRDLEEKTTKQVADKFNLTTNAAFRICGILAKKKLITKLDPVNGDNFGCCGWIRNVDPE